MFTPHVVSAPFQLENVQFNTQKNHFSSGSALACAASRATQASPKAGQLNQALLKLWLDGGPVNHGFHFEQMLYGES